MKAHIRLFQISVITHWLITFLITGIHSGGGGWKMWLHGTHSTGNLPRISTNHWKNVQRAEEKPEDYPVESNELIEIERLNYFNELSTVGTVLTS